MHTGLNASAVQGVITFLEEVLAEYLAEGYNVKLGNIGTFSATLTSRKVASKEEIRAKSIHFGDVSFRAAGELKKWYLEGKIDKDGRAPHIIYKKRGTSDGNGIQESDSQEV